MPAARSLSRRLILALTALMAAIWLAAAGTAAVIMQQELNESLDGALVETAQRLLVLSARTIAGQRAAGTPVADADIAVPSDEYLVYQVRDATGRVLMRSPNAPAAPLPVPLRRGFHTTDWAQVYTEETGDSLFIHIAESLSHRREALRESMKGLLLPMLLLIPASAGGVWWVVRRGMRPVRALQEEIGRRDSGNLSAVDGDGLPRELTPIAQSVNRLLARLRAALETERAFASNSAHELRTPIAAALAQTQRLIAELGGGRGRERAEQVEGALRRLGDLAEKLLQLSRAEAGIALSDVESDVLPALRLVVGELAGRQGYGQRLAVDIDMGRQLRRRIDIDAFGIALRNLVENALVHGSPERPVRLFIDDAGALHIVNGGPAVPAAVLKELKSRFNRGPTSASGSGLGLAIADAIVRQAGGRLDLLSPAAGEDEGFEAILALPSPGESLV